MSFCPSTRSKYSSIKMSIHSCNINNENVFNTFMINTFTVILKVINICLQFWVCYYGLFWHILKNVYAFHQKLSQEQQFNKYLKVNQMGCTYSIFSSILLHVLSKMADWKMIQDLCHWGSGLWIRVDSGRPIPYHYHWDSRLKSGGELIQDFSTLSFITGTLGLNL